MYLTRLDPKTGLLLIEDNEDGILAIKEFREILNSENLGLRCLTAIALTADYQSTIRYYSDKDRPRKAMEEVTGNRDAWPWNIEKIQIALRKYDSLQYDPTLEEGRIHYDQKVRKLKEIKLFETSPAEDPKRKLTSVAQLKKELRAVNVDIEDFEKRISGKDIYSESPVVNGYTLSRLEQKLENDKSFYHTR
jgi:hypothetical protein